MDSRRISKKFFINQPLGAPMTYKKISILTFILLLISFIGTIIVQKEQTEDDYESKKNTISHSSGGSIAQSGIESDTLERLKTHSESSTGWGMSPFGSGKPLTEESPQKTAFQMPNTEWKTRTLSGITYEFGKGNPKEVALDQAGLGRLSKECEDPNILNSLNEKGVCNPETARPYYLSPEVELHIISALSSPDWENLYQKCEKNIRFGDTAWRSQSSDPSLLFDQVFGSGILNIDNFITIDKENGRKKLNTNLVMLLIDFLEGSKAMIGRGEPIMNPYGDCVDQYSFGILHDLNEALNNYKIPE